MARRFIVGLVYCIVLYYASLFVVGMVAGHRATVEPGQDVVAVRNQAAIDAANNSRQIIGFAVVGLVFFGSRLGFLPGTRARERSPLSRV